MIIVYPILVSRIVSAVIIKGRRPHGSYDAINFGCDREASSSQSFRKKFIIASHAENAGINFYVKQTSTKGGKRSQAKWGQQAVALFIIIL